MSQVVGRMPQPLATYDLRHVAKLITPVLNAVLQAHLTQSGVWLLRGGGIHTGANTTLLWAALQRGHLAFADDLLARFAY